MLIGSYQPENTTQDNEETIRVILVDSREAMREGLRQMLSGDVNIKVVGEAKNGNEVITQAQKLSPDIIIMDASVRSTNSIETANRIRQSQLPVSIVMLDDNTENLVPAIESGAIAFLTKSVTRNQLIAAIRVVYLWRFVLFNEKEGHFALVKL